MIKIANSIAGDNGCWFSGYYAPEVLSFGGLKLFSFPPVCNDHLLATINDSVRGAPNVL